MDGNALKHNLGSLTDRYLIAMSKWKAASIYIAIWTVGWLLALALLPSGWAWLCIIALWIWTNINLVQVIR